MGFLSALIRVIRLHPRFKKIRVSHEESGQAKSAPRFTPIQAGRYEIRV
jgi:hypothetical protein